jgi:AcrR family transcriptional regulator
MPSRIKGISAKLIEAAREEFLIKGYEAASIRDIAAKAETSPRAVYTRFKNKEELFAAVVQPAIDSFYEQFRHDKEDYWDEESAKTRKPEDYYIRYLEYAYTHKTEFILVLEKSAGTRYENFIKDLAEADVQSVVCHLDMLREHDITFGADEADILFVNSITYSFYNDLFRPLTNGLTLDTAKRYAATLTNFYNYGLMGIMGIDK